MDSNQEGQVDKKLKVDLIADSQVKVEVKECSINDVPPEILMKILKDFDVKNLLVSRLVNRSWTGIASDLLRSRTDVEVKIDGSEHNRELGIDMPVEKKSLKEFVKCFNESKAFPCSRFLRHVEPSTFNDEDWIQFLSDFGKNIKRLELKIAHYSRYNSFIKMTEHLRTLLLTQLPLLEEFGLQFDQCESPISKTVRLFPRTETSTEDPTVQLPHLKVLHLDESSFSKFTGIITDLLQASVNLKTIQLFKKYTPFGDNVTTDLLFLQSQGKLHCLQAAVMNPTAELLSKFKEKSDTLPSEFKLKALELKVEHIVKNESIRSDATVFLTNLFESSKDTLEELDMGPLSFLQQFSFPKLSKLTSLCVQEIWGQWEGIISEPALLGGIKFMETFPVLQSLELHDPWTTAFPRADCIPFIPSLKSLHVTTTGMNKEIISQISAMCPNLRNFEISSLNDEGPSNLKNFPELGKAIWTHLKMIESLKFEIGVETEENAFPAIDSCITGISKRDCRRLLDLAKAQKLMKKWGSHGEIPKSELEVERKVSILDLKDLKNLYIHLFMWYEEEDGPLVDLTKSALTLVSEQYALKLMKNLTYEIKREVC